MEHLVRSLDKKSDLPERISDGFEDSADEEEASRTVPNGKAHARASALRLLEQQRSSSRESNGRDSPSLDKEHATPEMESRFFANLAKAKPGSRLSIADAADRHLRDKTDAIADIIRNISDQCAAAVEGLELAHDAENQDQIDPTLLNMSHKHKESLTASEGDASMHTDVSQLGSPSSEHGDADSGHGGSTGHLTPNGERYGRRESRGSIMPPTPDLVGGRSSTSMSGYTASTGDAPDRSSQQFHDQQQQADKTKIVDVEDPHDSGSETGVQAEHEDFGGKRQSEARPLTARIVAA